MGAVPFDVVLRQFNSGDPAAAAEVVRVYEPYLRGVVRRHLAPALRGRLDSDDVVQSVWVQALAGVRGSGWRFDDEPHLRAFLVRLTRLRLIDQLRQQRLIDEQPLPALAAADPEPAEVAIAGELWEQLVALCPPAHRELLRLRRAGVPTTEIAARTGLHEGSVRRVLGDLARKLAVRWGDNHGNPRANGPPPSIN
jgi:RNA polymerase sigma-70 factor (ECF subfamily)